MMRTNELDRGVYDSCVAEGFAAFGLAVRGCRLATVLVLRREARRVAIWAPSGLAFVCPVRGDNYDGRLSGNYDGR